MPIIYFYRTVVVNKYQLISYFSPINFTNHFYPFVCNWKFNATFVRKKIYNDMTALLILLGIVVVVALWATSKYNLLVKLRNNRENAFADIDVQLKQRHDLIPQLVATVKGYAAHEKETLEMVVNARNGAINAKSIDEKIVAENALSSALAGLKVTVEAYPDLKANTNFMQLQEEISDIENKLAAVRRFFNSATKELNTAVEMFPNNIIAGMFGFKREMMFDLGAPERKNLEKAPEISF
jgi:LemA protein